MEGAEHFAFTERNRGRRKKSVFDPGKAAVAGLS